MTQLYLLPYNSLILLSFAFLTALILQVFCTASIFFKLQYIRQDYWFILANGAAAVEIFFWIMWISEILYHIHDGCFYPELHSETRLFIGIVIILFSIICTLSKSGHSITGLLIPTFLLLPVADSAAGSFFPILPVLYVLLRILYSIHYLRLCSKRIRTKLTAFSIKEAIDTMDFGIMFCQSDGLSEGRILLSNYKMQDLIFTLFGHTVYDGKIVYQRLIDGQVRSDCIKSSITPQPIYTLPDKRVWRFDFEYMTIKTTQYALITAADITESTTATQKLYAQNTILINRNKELKNMLKNIESICRSEEILHTKNRVHDLLGQQISLILRSVRENRPLDIDQLKKFNAELPEELKKSSMDCSHSLDAVIKSFKDLGIHVALSGHLPDQPDLQKIFYESVTEAMTNAVHHGYATDIYIRITCTDHVWQLIVTNNGCIKKEEIIEGGGLQAMRRKAIERSGTFTYYTQPQFTIIMEIPEGV